MIESMVMIPVEAFNNKEDSYAIIYGNVRIVNELFGNMLTEEEICKEALLSYYLDYYDTQVENGGFSQFLFNSSLDPYLINMVEEALKAVGALKQLAIFKRGIKILLERYPDDPDDFLDDMMRGNKHIAAARNFKSVGDDYADSDENLLKLNAQWLRSLPNVLLLTIKELREKIWIEAEKNPVLAERKAKAKAEAKPRSLTRQPYYIKAIYKLCDMAGHDVDRMTIGDDVEYEGERRDTWYFLTDKGFFYVIDYNDKMIMFEEKTNKSICEIDISTV